MFLKSRRPKCQFETFTYKELEYGLYMTSRFPIEIAHNGSRLLGRSNRGLIHAKSILQIFAHFEEERDGPYNNRGKRNRDKPKCREEKVSVAVAIEQKVDCRRSQKQDPGQKAWTIPS